MPDIARLKQLKDHKRAARADPFTAATFDQEKMKEEERKKAVKVASNWKPTLATYSTPHKLSATSMVFGQSSVPRAAPAAPAPAEKVPDAPPCDDSAQAVPPTPESVTAAPRSLKTDPLVEMLQRPVQPWCLLSVR